jgi:predicted nucleotidyltransferase
MTTDAEHRAASGRFLVRTPPGLHDLLRREAREAGLSLNELCVRRLATPAGALAGWPQVAEVVARATAVVGDDLIGVVVFGSWARGAARADSDVDVLLVLESARPIARDLYRAWDESPLSWGSRPVEPHFVHLPAPGERVAGLWAEVAIDGVVLYARDPRIPIRLGQVRRDVVDGRIVRRVVHGQPYWVEAA